MTRPNPVNVIPLEKPEATHSGFVVRERIAHHELADAEMLRSLPVPALEDLARSAEVRRFRPGEVVFDEGDVGDTLFIVRRGVLKVIRPSDDPEIILKLLRPGETFGELAVLNTERRSASVIAVEWSETIGVSHEAFVRVVDEHPGALRRMLGDVARSLTLAKEQLVRQNVALEDRVRDRTKELHETQLELIRRLGQAVEARDGETGLHVTRISRFAHRLAVAAGLPADQSEIVRNAAQMHDIGKIGIPDSILLKPGKLDAAEWEIMKTHTTVGAAMLAGSRSEVLQTAAVIARSHHEKWNGAGYPDGLEGEQIPLVARICAICDVFDALISERPYKPAWPADKALAEIERGLATDFDPRLVPLFLELAPQVLTELGPRR